MKEFETMTRVRKMALMQIKVARTTQPERAGFAG